MRAALLCLLLSFASVAGAAEKSIAVYNTWLFVNEHGLILTLRGDDEDTRYHDWEMNVGVQNTTQAKYTKPNGDTGFKNEDSELAWVSLSKIFRKTVGHYSLYGGVGIGYTLGKIHSRLGSKANFLLSAGVGHLKYEVGLRHLSNGDLTSDNKGWNVVYFSHQF